MVDVIKVLKFMESNQLIRLNRVIGDWYSIWCPFHSNGNEHRPSCGVLLHDKISNGNHYTAGMFHCFTCGYAKDLHSSVSDILKLHNVPASVAEELNEMIGDSYSVESEKLFPESMIQSMSAKFALNTIRMKSNKNIGNYVSEEELQTYRVTVPYLYERKLTDYIIDRYDVGVDMHYVPKGGKREIPCVTFPVRDANGRTLFILRRAIPIKRFYLPDNVQKPVYGIDMLPNSCTSVLIVESCFNCLTAVSYGYPSVALLGTGTPYQIEQLKRLGVSEFVICLDGDTAGIAGTRKLQRALKSIAITWVIDMPNGKDVNDCSKVEFDKYYQSRH